VTSKVVFFTGSQSLMGGTERACANTARLLSECDQAVGILSLYRGKNSGYQIPEAVELHELYDARPKGLTGFLGGAWRLYRFVKREKPDYVVAVESISFLYLLSLFASPRRPVLINWEHFNASITLGRFSRKLARTLAVWFADQIVVLSDHDLFLWQKKLGAPSSKLKRIYNPNPYEGPLSTMPAESFEDGRLSVIAAGRLTAQKGFDLLVEAWAKVPEEVRSGWQLKIFGDGPDRASLSKQIVNFGLGDEILLLGQCDDIAREYMQAEVFVLPSRFEGFGLVLVEALSFGLPVVSFNCPAGPSEIVQDGVNGILVPAMDIGELANALAQLMSDDGKRAAIGLRAPSGLDRFSSPVIRNQWMELISHYNTY